MHELFELVCVDELLVLQKGEAELLVCRRGKLTFWFAEGDELDSFTFQTVGHSVIPAYAGLRSVCASSIDTHRGGSLSDPLLLDLTFSHHFLICPEVSLLEFQRKPLFVSCWQSAWACPCFGVRLRVLRRIRH